jgi:hypothetical protein
VTAPSPDGSDVVVPCGTLGVRVAQFRLDVAVWRFEPAAPSG